MLDVLIDFCYLVAAAAGVYALLLVIDGGKQ